ncbi:hypothetical protein QO010_001382 [Caulobacter ginsengisoli]|uniref:Phytanoyl-CoA dioxygenase n=1 Tax=Caulobacter ginsengisoli TaxID=400775 RepID=A0ABU0INN7_9CAUL|nr:phytanoyl-CoA dioxygenase family protein [Caulobacter ginsengisoli]MDQ0463611.1 hypothetical protein [Caulobacter ginsengisoli]
MNAPAKKIGTLGLDFKRDGAVFHPAALDAATVAALRSLDIERAGVRLSGEALAGRLAAATGIAETLLGPGARPVRAVMFDKTAADNWMVAWHQDRTVCVRERLETPGFGPWSVKHGLTHVAPPIDVLEAMVTLRLHLDDCGPDNAPLQAALGSHRLGRVAASDAAGRALTHPILECLAASGDVWAYSTPILHASARARVPARRRVLQLDYAAFDLPGGLQWLGLAT